MYTDFIREVLRDAARYRGTYMIVALDAKACQEKSVVQSILYDAILLQNIGLHTVFVSCGGRNDVLIAEAEQGNIHVYEMDNVAHLFNTAQSVRAPKVIFLTDRQGLYSAKEELIREMTNVELEEMLQQQEGVFDQNLLSDLRAVASAFMTKGIQRFQIIPASQDGAILLEVLTSKGVGTMIYKENSRYKAVRWAESSDHLEISRVLEHSGVEAVEGRKFLVYMVDETLHSVFTVPCDDGEDLTIEYLGASEEFAPGEILEQLLVFVAKVAVKRHTVKLLFLAANDSPFHREQQCLLDAGFKLEGGSGQKKGWRKEISF